MGDLIQLLRAGKIGEFRAAVKADGKAARHPRAVVEAGRLAFQPALAALKSAGADLNAAWRNYRPVHSLLQEDPHIRAGKPDPERVACLEWLLANGADPEQVAAWPSARAIVVAAFVGSPEYVAVLRQGGAKMDGFALAALGDVKRVEKGLAARPEFARERDHGGLTALQCAAGSRMPKAATLEVARLLIEAGAEVTAQTKSWNHDVDAAYLAAGTKKLELFELLLDRGADATASLTHAVWGKAYDLAEAALARGAKIDRATGNGKPLLNDLICWGQIAQAMWLLERGASPNVADERGWTAVHQAASRGNARVLQAVLDASGDTGRRDREGRLPKDVAHAKLRGEIAGS